MILEFKDFEKMGQAKDYIQENARLKTLLLKANTACNCLQENGQ